MEFTPKKEIAKQFLTLIGNGEIDKAFANYTAQDFKHHNPFFAKEKTALVAGMKEQFASFPEMKVTILRLIEQNDLVMAHSVVKRQPKAQEVVVVHIFRFKEHLITEFWDILQQAPDVIVNENGTY